MKRIAMIVMACAFVLGSTVGCSSLCCDPCEAKANPCQSCGCEGPCGCR